ncbi:hypothetical protein PGT21_030748 [Puccinia graminis f. sp. tritici]|uniref:Uncharacterized protein n=1 Tax=Puccinia graminis f. sp. tritici TaxID=56615 RepID=A0A5B0R3W9_PUCGR|nr:hypothetical protein PGT21_030748 [Puccinia graminis f. sp. tritici]
MRAIGCIFLVENGGSATTNPIGIGHAVQSNNIKGGEGTKPDSSSIEPDDFLILARDWQEHFSSQFSQGSERYLQRTIAVVSKWYFFVLTFSSDTRDGG